MWTCLGCAEKVEDNFDVCWQCGMSRDGVPDPNFMAERDIEPVAAPSYLDLESEIVRRFSCSKCAYDEALLKRISPTVTGISKLGDILHNQYLILSCAKCGYSEMYDSHILNRQANVSEILDRMFGS